jgi:hypothetical protein
MKLSMRLAIPFGVASLLSAYGAYLFAHVGGAGNIVASVVGIGVIMKSALAAA